MKNCNRAKKLLASVCLVLAAASLSGCGVITFPDRSTDAVQTTENPPADTTAAPVSPVTGPVTTQPKGNEEPQPVTALEQAQALVDALPVMDFENEPVFIAQVETRTDVLFRQDSVATPLHGGILRRNAMVEKKFNTHLLTRNVVSEEQLAENIRISEETGEYYADLILCSSATVGIMYRENSLYNLNSLPFTDFTADYFNYDAMVQASGGYHIYGAMGAATDTMLQNYVCFVNTGLLTGSQKETVSYEAMIEGTWTWDSLFALSLKEGVSLLSSDLDEEGLNRAVFLSSGSHFLTCRLGTTPSLSYANPKTDVIISTLSLLQAGKATGEDGIADFLAGKSLLCIAPLETALSFPVNFNKWNLMPLPKCRAEDDYYTLQSTSRPVVCVPAQTPDIARAGMLLQCFFAASYRHLNEDTVSAYAGEYLQSNRDILTVASMTDLPVQHDFSDFFASSYSEIQNVTTGLFARAVRRESVLDGTYDGGSDAAQNVLKQFFATVVG